jgi:hypothetical protein
MQERLAPENVNALRTLGEVVEPVKGYRRSSKGRYLSDSPLNGLPDSVPPESIAARKFSELVDRIVAGNASADELARVHDLLDEWRVNHQRLAPALRQMPLSDDSQTSQNLSAAGAIGMQALETFIARTPAPAGWADQQIAQLESMKKSDTELLLMIVPAVEKLVSAAGK